MRLLWYLLIGVVLYRFVVRFLLPVLQLTKHTSQRMRQMQDQVNNMAQQQQPAPKQKKVEGTYIDYEEVK